MDPTMGQFGAVRRGPEVTAVGDFVPPRRVVLIDPSGPASTRQRTPVAHHAQVRVEISRIMVWLARPRVSLAISVAIFALPVLFVLVTPHPLEQPLGVDAMLYRDVTLRWVGGGQFYQPYQLTGPYEIRAGDVLYPPVGLILFVPFTVLPVAVAGVLWWAIPLGVTAWAIRRLRPRPEVWPLIALCVAWPTTLLKTWTGNPVIWSTAAMALGVVYAWPSVLVLVKPSLAPFALFGVWRRSWWIAAIGFGIACLPFGAMWADWVASVANSRGGGPLYSTLEIPMLILPLVAWSGRRA
jgi:hypothetical protein